MSSNVAALFISRIKISLFKSRFFSSSNAHKLEEIKASLKKELDIKLEELKRTNPQAHHYYQKYVEHRNNYMEIMLTEPESPFYGKSAKTTDSEIDHLERIANHCGLKLPNASSAQHPAD
jgi:uncharacterized protein (DUF3084 family)